MGRIGEWETSSPGAIAIRQLNELRQWFDEFVADQWDNQIQADAQAGKLDFLLQQVDDAHKEGKVRPFNP